MPPELRARSSPRRPPATGARPRLERSSELPGAPDVYAIPVVSVPYGFIHNPFFPAAPLTVRTQRVTSACLTRNGGASRLLVIGEASGQLQACREAPADSQVKRGFSAARGRRPPPTSFRAQPRRFPGAALTNHHKLGGSSDFWRPEAWNRGVGGVPPVRVQGPHAVLRLRPCPTRSASFVPGLPAGACLPTGFPSS